MKFLSVDRFEGTYVICEDSEKKFFAIEKGEAPTGVAEGDVLRIDDDGTMVIDQQETARRKKNVSAKQNKLWED